MKRTEAVKRQMNLVPELYQNEFMIIFRQRKDVETSDHPKRGDSEKPDE